jgi:membrane protease YdiL (CAAX protease family)
MLAIALPCTVFISSLLIVGGLFHAKLRMPSLFALFLSILSIPFGPVWEELAWRGFALRMLQVRYSRLASALILGVYWAAWHVPLWMLTMNGLTFALLLIIFGNLACWSVIFSFLYNRSEDSLPVVILLHATLQLIQNLAFSSVSVGAIYMIPTAAVLSLSLSIVIARRFPKQKLCDDSYDRRISTRPFFS